MPIQLSGSGSITGVSTFSGPITSLDVSGNVSVGGTLTYDDVTSIDSVGVITARAGVEVPDNQKIILGTGEDLQVYHDGTDSYVDNQIGDLILRTSSVGDDVFVRAMDDVFIQPGNGANGVTVKDSGAVELYHNNSKKFETTNTGVDITGELECDSLDVSGSIELDGELNFLGGEGHKYIDCNLGSGALNIRGTSGGDTNHRYLAKFVRNGPVELYYNNVQKFETTNSGIKVSGSFPDIVIHDTDTTNDNFRILHNGGGTQLLVDPNNVGPNASHFIIGIDGTERLRMESGGTIKFAANNSSTDYLEWGGNPRLVLQAPSGLNGLRIYSDTTPLEVGGDASTRKISMGGNPNYDLSISGSYSLSSGGHDSSPKVFLNATRHNGSSTVTSFQTSIQAVSASNTANDGYLGLGASATPDDLVIRPSGNIGIGDNNPDTKLTVKAGSGNQLRLDNAGERYTQISLRNNGSQKAALWLDNTNNLFTLYGSTNIGIRLDTNGTERLRITSGGDVVIGNSSAADGAHFQHYTSAARHQSFQSTNGDLAIVTDNNNNPAAYIKGTGTADLLRVSDNTTQVFTIKDGGEIKSGNLSINAFANQNTPSGYAQFQFDNHYNTLFAQNLKLGASGGNGNHQIEIINQHATIGGAGMYMGGNGSNQQNAINFYAEAANQSPGTDVTANRRAQVNSSSFFTWVEPRNQSSNAQSYLRTFGFTFNLQDGETETLFYNPDSYRRIWYEMYFQSGHGSNGYGYILANISRYGMQVHDVDWHVAYTSYAFSGSVGGNVSHNGFKLTRNSGYANTNITYYAIIKCFSPAGGSPYSNSGLTDPSYRYFSQGY